jgi:F-type H+-transporting ATPase subunit delta
MKQLAMNYGKILFDLSIAEETVMRSKEIFQSSNELLAALENPAVKETEKAAVIDLIFDKTFANFLKVVSENKMISNINEIFEAYDEAALENSNMLKATLSYVTKPTEEQIEKIKLM